LNVRSLLEGLPEAPGIYESGADAVVEILEAPGVTPHRHIRGVWPPAQAVEAGFSHGPVFVYELKGATANLETGAIYDAQGALIREAFGTGEVMRRYLPHAALPDRATIAEASAPVLPLATTRAGNFCRWWLDSMAKPYLVGRSSLAARGAVPTIFGARPQFQRDGLFLLDDMRVLGHDAPWFVRGDIVSSPGVSYNGGQSIGRSVVDFGRHFAARGLGDAAAPADLPRKLFISRRKAKIRRIVDEEALAAALAAEGFVTIQLEKLSLAQQMAYFAQAEVIVAPHGAGLTNLLWSRPELTLVEIFPEGGVHGSAFLRIASHIGLRYFAVVGAAGPNRDRKGNPNNADIVLDLPAVMAFLKAEVLAG
jgi:capsular polysaccharide biosynthesis protein